MWSNCSELSFPNFTNLSEFVHNTLGDRCLDVNVAVTTEILYGIILVLGVFGNVTTCVVILTHPGMKTVTNYYLFSLAISDLITLILGLPFELYNALTAWYPYEMPELICKSRAYLSEVTSNASVLTIAAFSIERWLAICFPFRFQTFSKTSRAIKVIVGVWIGAFLSASPVFHFMKISRLVIQPNDTQLLHLPPIKEPMVIPGTEFCSLDFYNPNVQAVLINYSFWLFFITPLVLMLVLYSFIGYTIRKKQLPMRERFTGDQKQFSRQAQSRNVVIRMLSAVCACFFICWAPFHIQRICSLYIVPGNASILDSRVMTIIFHVSGICYYSNACVNPILYNVFNRKFRRAFHSVVCLRGAEHPDSSQLLLSSVKTQIFREGTVSPPSVVRRSKSLRAEHSQLTTASIRTYSSSSSATPLIGRSTRI